jgi:hypothetical protein
MYGAVACCYSTPTHSRPVPGRLVRPPYPWEPSLSEASGGARPSGDGSFPRKAFEAGHAAGILDQAGLTVEELIEVV